MQHPPKYKCAFCSANHFSNKVFLDEHYLNFHILKGYNYEKLYNHNSIESSNLKEKIRKHIENSYHWQKSKIIETKPLVVNERVIPKIKNNKFYKCSLCQRSFKRHFHLKRHQLVVSCSQKKPKSHKCSKCNKGFTYKFTLTRHVKTCH